MKKGRKSGIGHGQEEDRVQEDTYCTPVSKVGWFTEEKAKEALEAAQRRETGRKGRLEARYYLCPWGAHYHLTSRADPD